MNNELITAHQTAMLTGGFNIDKWEQWKKEWNKVQHSIAETITGMANHGHWECTFNLKSVEFTEIAKDLTYLKHQFESRGYEVRFKLQRSPNGAKEMIVKW